MSSGMSTKRRTRRRTRRRSRPRATRTAPRTLGRTVGYGPEHIAILRNQPQLSEDDILGISFNGNEIVIRSKIDPKIYLAYSEGMPRYMYPGEMYFTKRGRQALVPGSKATRTRRTRRYTLPEEMGPFRTSYFATQSARKPLRRYSYKPMLAWPGNPAITYTHTPVFPMPHPSLDINGNLGQLYASKKLLGKVSRKSPKDPAKKFALNTRKKGLDGKMWIVKKSKSGKRWVRSK